LGEYWRRKLVANPDKETNWYVLFVLIAGLLVFASGSIAIFRPVIPNDEASILLICTTSIAVGFLLSYLLNRYRRPSDLSI
jgi:hypothetical protein